MSGRAQPGYCPYCGEEDLRPTETPDPAVIAQGGARGAEPAGAGRTHQPAAWECRGCARVFSVRFLGLSATILEVHR